MTWRFRISREDDREDDSAVSEDERLDQWRAEDSGVELDDATVEVSEEQRIWERIERALPDQESDKGDSREETRPSGRQKWIEGERKRDFMRDFSSAHLEKIRVLRYGRRKNEV